MMEPNSWSTTPSLEEDYIDAWKASSSIVGRRPTVARGPGRSEQELGQQNAVYAAIGQISDIYIRVLASLSRAGVDMSRMTHPELEDGQVAMSVGSYRIALFTIELSQKWYQR